MADWFQPDRLNEIGPYALLFGALMAGAWRVWVWGWHYETQRKDLQDTRAERDRWYLHAHKLEDDLRTALSLMDRFIARGR